MADEKTNITTINIYVKTLVGDLLHLNIDTTNETDLLTLIKFKIAKELDVDFSQINLFMSDDTENLKNEDITDNIMLYMNINDCSLVKPTPSLLKDLFLFVGSEHLQDDIEAIRTFFEFKKEISFYLKTEKLPFTGVISDITVRDRNIFLECKSGDGTAHTFNIVELLLHFNIDVQFYNNHTCDISQTYVFKSCPGNIDKIVEKLSSVCESFKDAFNTYGSRSFVTYLSNGNTKMRYSPLLKCSFDAVNTTNLKLDIVLDTLYRCDNKVGRAMKDKSALRLNKESQLKKYRVYKFYFALGKEEDYAIGRFLYIKGGKLFLTEGLLSNTPSKNNYFRKTMYGLELNNYTLDVNEITHFSCIDIDMEA